MRASSASPGVPLDIFEDFGAAQYGNWVFFEYLSNGSATPSYTPPGSEAAAVGDKRGLFSIRAVENALPAGTTFPDLFGDYTASNTEPSDVLSRGRAGGRPPRPPGSTC